MSICILIPQRNLFDKEVRFVALLHLKGPKHDQIECGFFLHKSNLYGLVTWELGQKKIFGLVWALYYPLLPEIFA